MTTKGRHDLAGCSLWAPDINMPVFITSWCLNKSENIWNSLDQSECIVDSIQKGWEMKKIMIIWKCDQPHKSYPIYQMMIKTFRGGVESLSKSLSANLKLDVAIVWFWSLNPLPKIESGIWVLWKIEHRVKSRRTMFIVVIVGGRYTRKRGLEQ